MKNVIVKQCDYCEKTSKYKSQMKKHEAKCFSNPQTHCCATCLWYGKNHFINGYCCFIGKGHVHNSTGTIEFKLQTQCSKWVNIDFINEIDILSPSNQDFLSMILSGDEGIINAVKNWNKVPFD